MIEEAAQFGRVAVLMGGWAAEREISLLSGQAVLAGLRSRGVDAHGIDVQRTVLQQLQAGAFDRAFVVLHGRGGEDGVIQGALEVLGLPYTGTGVLGSALGMDKYRCKLLWRGLGLPTPEFALVEDEGGLRQLENINFPVIVKPAHEGSSIGIARADDTSQLQSAWRAAAEFDREVIVESWIEGSEYTVAVVGDEALPVIKLETPHLFYDYEAKYEADDTCYLVPCGLPGKKECELQQLALEAFRATGASGWGRVDLMMDAEGRPWLIEINTVPGMTDHSLVPMAAKARGMDFAALVWRILEQTLVNK